VNEKVYKLEIYTAHCRQKPAMRRKNYCSANKYV